MRAAIWLCAVVCTTPTFAAERMSVSVCTEGHPGARLVAEAESEAAAVFRSVDVEIAWTQCRSAPIGEEAARQHWFTVRLRTGKPFFTTPMLSLDTLGEAFFADDQPAYLAEVYYEAAQQFASLRGVDPGVLLGCVMAHELGHLLLGPGHARHGIMRQAWNSLELDEMRFGRLKFDSAESDQIRKVLEVSSDNASGS
jgi:hypothetical protein